MDATTVSQGVDVTMVAAGADPAELSEALLHACSEIYAKSHPHNTLQVLSFEAVTFLFDANPRYDRTVAALKRPDTPVSARDASYQRGYPLTETVGGRRVDRGHFIPHTAGGGLGPNLYVQDRALNRGWSREGQEYRALERRAVAAGDEAIMLAFPIYLDDSAVPAYVQLSIVTADGIESKVFRNRFDLGIDSVDSLSVLLDGATNAQIGAVGEETVAVLLEESGATIVTLGDAGLDRVEGRQDLDIVAIVDGSLVAFEVKTRYGSRRAGTVTRAGNLPRPRLRTSRSGHRQASQPYVTDRIERIIDTGRGYQGVDVQVVVVDLVAMLAQFYSLDDNGTRLTPSSSPVPCRDAVEAAVKRILDYRGFL